MTTALTAICTGESYPLHVVLVLDGSSSMAGQSTDTVKRLAHAWVDSFDLSNNPAITVAVVEINQPSKRLCGPSRSAWDINNCIDRLSANGGSDIAGALRLGLRAIDDGRGSAVDRDSIREVMLVLTDGGNSDGCAPVLSVAGQAKGQGVLMTTACVTAGCDDSCLRSAATSPRYFFAVDQLDSITGMFETLRNWYQNIIIKTAALTETISSTFAWIDGSARPEPRAWHGQRIAWWYTHVPHDGITMTIGLQPLSAALDVPVFSDVGSQLVDNKGRAVAPTLDVPRVDVLDARFGAPPAPLTATVPISNHLTVDAPRAFVGQRLRAHYHLELPSGDARRLNVAMIQLRVPDHLRVGATWWNGRKDGQVDGDERGAQWLVLGTGEDAFDVEAELTAIGPGDGGLGVAVYRWATDGLTPPKLIVAAVSRPVSADAPTTPTLPTATRPAPTPTASAVRIFLPVTLAEACLAGPLRRHRRRRRRDDEHGRAAARRRYETRGRGAGAGGAVGRAARRRDRPAGARDVRADRRGAPAVAAGVDDGGAASAYRPRRWRTARRSRPGSPSAPRCWRGRGGARRRAACSSW
ncbi:MAG: vWA domain-containing protein [Anaerolineae bacterium]